MQRWKANEKSEEKALFDLQAVREVEIKRLNECKQTRMSRSSLEKFKCVVDAWLQIAWLRDFDDFCIRLEMLTKSTNQYFENLIQGFQNNLSEVSRINAPAGCA